MLDAMSTAQAISQHIANVEKKKVREREKKDEIEGERRTRLSTSRMG